jgi:hypothetical protein
MEILPIFQKIHELRGKKVMLDFDLAEMYEVQTKALNQAVKRNIERFPLDFMFQLSTEEWTFLRSQFVTLKNNQSQIVTGSQKHRDTKHLPYAFTEQGVAMLSSVLRSPKAIAVNIAIMRAFVAMREYAMTYTELAQRLTELEIRFEDVEQALTLLMRERKDKKDWEKRDRIGFNK